MSIGIPQHDAEHRRDGHGLTVPDIHVTQSPADRTPTIKRELRPRSAIEPIIGHTKSDGLLERNRLAGAKGDAINAILMGAGHNIRLLLAWLRTLLSFRRKPLALYGPVKDALRERLAIEMPPTDGDTQQTPYNLRHIRTVLLSNCESLLNLFCDLINLSATNGSDLSLLENGAKQLVVANDKRASEKAPAKL
jgi:hypothetical protein